jgi:hypothetical protein
MSDTYRSDPKRAAELAVILTQYAVLQGAEPSPSWIAGAVAEMQAAARSAKRRATHACNYGLDDKQEAAQERWTNRAQAKINAALAKATVPQDRADMAPKIELGGDPRGPCARLHIPGQKGDGWGWGDGFAVY